MSDLGADPLLSSEEMNALLDAMRSGETGPRVDSADVASPDRLLRAALPRVEEGAEALAGAIRGILLRQAGSSGAGQAIAPRVEPFRSFLESIRPGSLVVRLESANGAPSFATLGPKLVAIMLDRRLGLPINECGTRETQRLELSSVDRRVLAPFFRTLLETFAHGLSGDARSLIASEFFPNAAELEEFPHGEPLVRVAVTITLAGREPEDVVFALTSALLRDTSPPGEEEAVRTATRDDRLRMGERVAATEIDAIAVLGTRPSTVRQVLSLAVGDVIRLDTAPDQPTPVFVQGHLVLRGKPFVQRGNLAIEVTDVRR